MRLYSSVFFSLILISSIILISSYQASFAEDVIATSIGFENSTIFELKNGRNNVASIDSVRIWLSGENEFKTFKTEQGWIGKKELNGVIEFKTKNEINPGDSVKFGIKTVEHNPIINWKALDRDGNVIESSTTRITKLDISNEQSEFNQSKVIAIKEKSNFRFVPELLSSNSDFRVIGENFVPNQTLDFYVGNNLQHTIKVNNDGRILFTAKAPSIDNEKRIEFTLRDSGGNEKSLSIRIQGTESRDIPEDAKLTLGNTPQQVKRGDIIILEGTGTPNTTLTITNKDKNSDILIIDTINVGFNGKWNYNNLISPEMKLGIISIEISDGKSLALRNIEIISAKLINILAVESMYESGDEVFFTGTAIPKIDMSVILEDSIGAEIFSRTIKVGESGKVEFKIKIERGSVEGTYILSSFQGKEEGITLFGVGQEPQPIIILRPTELNYSPGSIAKVSIVGPINAQVSLILIDSADREKISESINLGPDGKEVYEINTDNLSTGSYTLNAKRGESSGTAIFTVGLSTGSGSILVQTTRDEYKQGEHLLILGNTAKIHVLLDITISDPSGKIIKKIETFSDKSGMFKVDNFRVPIDGDSGTWIVNVKSGGNFKQIKFFVADDDEGLTLFTDRNEYDISELVNIYGTGARMSSTVTIKIFDSGGDEIQELNISAKGNGEYATIWKIPPDLEGGKYDITADDGKTNVSMKITLNVS